MREVHMSLKDIKSTIKKDIKNESEVLVKISIYDCDDTHDIEINYYIDGEHQSTYCPETFSGDDSEAEAVKRANAILNSVKGWFDGNGDVTVGSNIALYS